MRIRQGNDFIFLWAIERSGEPENFSNAVNIRLHFKNFDCVGEVKSFQIVDGNIVRVEVSPEWASNLGAYRLILSYEFEDESYSDGDRKCVVDVLAFNIVPKTSEADDVTEMAKTTDIMIGLKGDKGDPFTYDDFTPEQIEDLKRPAVEAAESVLIVENQISINEQGRVQAENERETAELTRQSSESERNEAEGVRVNAESERATAESSRELAESLRVEAELLRQSSTQEAISNAENATENANNAATNANNARLAIQDDLALKADQADLVQLAGEVSQSVKKTDSKIYIGAVQTELDFMYNGPNAIAQLGTALSDGRFICNFGHNLTSFNDVMNISWQRTDIRPSSIPYERDGYIYVASETQLYKLTLEGIDVKTYPIANINSVAVAPNGNIAVGRNGAVGEKTVIYMDNDGLELWSNTEVANCAAVDIDGNGNVLAGHYINQAGDGLRIYDSAGVNKKQIGRTYVVDAKFDNDDNVIVVALVHSAGIHKYDKSLNQLWYRSEVESNYTSRSKFSIGDDNTIYAPSFSTTAGIIDCYRFTADGDLIYKFASGGAARASSLVSDNNGYVYLTFSIGTSNTLIRFKEYNKVRIW